MASPWVTPQPHQRTPVERPWMGMAMLVAVPLLALVLIRMLWSGSGLWFLTVGIILLGAAAVVFLARRNQEQEYGRPVLATEPNRLPLVLTGLGVFFLAMLLLPNFADGDSPTPGTALQEQPDAGLQSEVSGAVQPPAQEPAAGNEQPVAPNIEAPAAAAPEGSDVYIVQSGDNLWDIATRFGTTVDAIVAANALADPADIAVDQELIIPPPDVEVGPSAGEDAAAE